MPVNPTYPGVYIEEIPSGVRTISGVATSITAFLGAAPRGPVDEPTTLNSFGDYERVFGGLSTISNLGYAVQDFFLNGGGQAIVVRVYAPPSSVPSSAATGAAATPSATPTVAATVPPGAATAAAPGATTAAAPASPSAYPGVALLQDTGKALFLRATSPGTWANKLRARIDVDVLAATATRLGVNPGDLFNLTVRDNLTGETEVFQNVTLVESSRRLDRVLQQNSRLVRVNSLGTAIVAHAAATANVWSDDTQSSPVSTDGQNGSPLGINDFTGNQAGKRGLYALEKADLFNLLVIPPYLPTGDVDQGLLDAAAAYCEQRRAMLLIDPPSAWTNKDLAKAGIATFGTRSKNAALYFPRIRKTNPLHDNMLEDFAPAGAVAGIFARTDSTRGVWKAPAGLEATLTGVLDLSVPLTDAENGELNPLGLNCLRVRPAAGPVVWGARTREGDDRLASDWKYVPVRRLALYLEESLYRGTQWVVFEPNDEPLWAQIRLNVGAFLQGLFRQGAFKGRTSQEAYFVKVDRETTTQNDVNRGIVNVVVGFAPLKPAEFVILKIQQIAGQIQT